MESIWKHNIEKSSFATMQGDMNTDVLIIGGGLCGILCAYMLQKAGVDCILVEADRICAGITNGTTAKITFQHGLIYNKIINMYGTEQAKLYYQSQKNALEELTKIASSLETDLNFCNSFVYSLTDRAIIEKEMKALDKIGCKAEFCEKTELPFDVAGAVKIEKQAQFHPLKFAYGITKDLAVYENTKVLGLKPHTAVTNRGKITAKKIIVATHFPFINKHGGYFLKMYQHRSYVLALENVLEMKDMYVDEGIDGLSFRGYKNLLLLGGGSHRTGSEGGNWAELEGVVSKYYPSAREVGRWATQDCMTLDSVPYIGQYSKAMPDVYVATGFNKWGMTSSMVSAMVLTDLVRGIQNEYRELYAPTRSVWHPQLAVNLFESVKGLLTPTSPRCPHMGCALKYNKAEHSWDCPCHGSRFEENGKLINNPATDDKNE
ncbi:MAG: FAD-dependent oxidoreductase [Ruminococcaceae bacterium]|nr:FAD-dependent oxidoreductase [Oscillospiraceae bacterium]